MTALVTDAYSPSNLGDGELVRLTIAFAKNTYKQAPIVLATDPNGFAPMGALFVSPKPLSRQKWRNLSGVRRYVWLLQEVLAIAAALALGSGSRGSLSRRALGRRIGHLLNTEWLVHFSNAEHVIGVGGGYLGDKYLRETVLTLIQYRLAISFGATVETMPLSVSSAHRRRLRIAFRNGGRGVVWRSREATTHATLSSFGLSSRLVPDLAWLNVLEPVSSNSRAGLTVAPLGSAFYSHSSGALPNSWALVQRWLDSAAIGTKVNLVAMHAWDERLQDGRDDLACRLLFAEISRAYPHIQVQIFQAQNYREVRELFASSEYAICERLHAAIAALTVGTPTAVIGYEPKHAGVLEFAGLLDQAVEADSDSFPSTASGKIMLLASKQGSLALSVLGGTPSAYSAH